MIWKSNSGNLLGINIAIEIKLDEYISGICLQTNKKFSFIARFSKFLSSTKQQTLFKSIIGSPFKYCLLIRTFHA